MTKPMVTVKLATGELIDCEVSKHQYHKNKQIALQLHAAETERNIENDAFPGEPMGTPTVCFPDSSFNENETAIKNCDEYSGFLEALEQAGVVRRTSRHVVGPHISYNVVEVLI